MLCMSSSLERTEICVTSLGQQMMRKSLAQPYTEWRFPKHTLQQIFDHCMPFLVADYSFLFQPKLTWLLRHDIHSQFSTKWSTFSGEAWSLIPWEGNCQMNANAKLIATHMLNVELQRLWLLKCQIKWNELSYLQAKLLYLFHFSEKERHDSVMDSDVLTSLNELHHSGGRQWLSREKHCWRLQYMNRIHNKCIIMKWSTVQRQSTLQLILHLSLSLSH